MSRRPADDDDDPREHVQEDRPRRPPARPPEEEQMQEGQPRRPAPPPSRESDEDMPRRRRPPSQEGDGYSGVVPYRNAFALVGYYMGFLGLIAILGGIAFIMFRVRQDPFAAAANPALIAIVAFGVIYGLGGISAVLAIIFGGVGLAKASQGKGTAHAIVGIVLGSLEIIGLIVILLFGMVSTGRVR